MIVAVESTTITYAAEIHSAAWRESHCSFCSPAFVAVHSPEHQKEYILEKMCKGSSFYILIDDEPKGIVSVTGGLIEDLYVLPKEQNKGYGTKLLQFAIEKCTETPSLWILENNTDAERLYQRMGFRRTGKINTITGKLHEIELVLK